MRYQNFILARLLHNNFLVARHIVALSLEGQAGRVPDVVRNFFVFKDAKYRTTY